MQGLSVLFFVCVVILNIDAGSALKCYGCNATLGVNDDCEVNVTNVEPVDCGLALNTCYTLISSGGIMRSCLIKETCKLFKGIYKECYTCNTDMCNSGFLPSYSTSLGVTVVLFVLTRLFM